MDISTLGLKAEEIIGGIIAIIIGVGWARKKFSFDNLEITKSNTERELIEILRTQIIASSNDVTEIKNQFNELEKKTKDIARERDEALKDNDLYKEDIKRLENKITILEGIIQRLTDALEITSAKLNDSDDDQSSSSNN